MKRIIAVLSLCLAVAAPALAKDKAPKTDVKALKPTIAEGWEGTFNEVMEDWTFEKYTAGADGNEPNRFYISRIDTSRPSDVEKYAKKLQTDKTFQDYGSLFISIASKEKLPNGWLITGVEKDMNDAEDKGMPAFVLYRTDLGLYCRGSVFRSDALRSEAIEACKTMK